MKSLSGVFLNPWSGKGSFMVLMHINKRGVLLYALILLSCILIPSSLLAQLADGAGGGGDSSVGSAGGVVSAGHFIAGVLEHMGYQTQARYLEKFQSFFRDAGALIYFFAAVFSLLSVLLFGSARAVRYLLVGPALYWFLVGPVSNVEGVVWKLGGGEPRGLLGQTGMEAAQRDRDDVIRNMGTEPQRNIRVATGFWLFVRPINEITERVVDLFLDDEDSEALMVADKVRGLELISRMIPEDAGMIHRLEHGLLAHCGKSYHAALGLAENYIKDRATHGLPQRARSTSTTRINEITSKKQEDFDNAIMQYMPTGDTKFKEFIEAVRTVSKPAARAYDVNEGKVLDDIPCHLGWDIFFDELFARSAHTAPDTLRLTSGMWQSEGAFEKACNLLSRKILDDEPEQECNLVPGIALATFWNHTSRGDTFGRVLARHSTYQDPLNPGEHSKDFSVISQGFSPSLKKQVFDGATILGPVAQVFAIGGHLVHQSLSEKINEGPDGIISRTTEFAPNVQISAINGIDHATYTSMPAYETNRVRQQLLTWALQMPYYQGVLLYLIAISYPFIALLVLVPGKAVNFLNVPLFWLWVKSWDVGFAAIVLLEKVLYNMLPNWALPNALRRTWTWSDLPMILGEGYNFNHIQGVAQHYSVLAMCTMAIPAITGAMILKGKRNLLGNFTNAIDNQSRSAASRSAGAHSITTANERAQMMKQIAGAAIQTPRLQAGGVGGGLRGGSARFGALTQVFSSGLQDASKKSGSFFTDKGDAKWQEHLKGSLDAQHSIASKMAGKFPEYLSGVGSRIGAEAQLDSALQASFGTLGRWSEAQMFNDAYAGALDGAGAVMQGGFESNDVNVGFLNQMVSQFKERTNDVTNMSARIAAAEGHFIYEGLKAGTMQITDSSLKGEVGSVVRGVAIGGALAALATNQDGRFSESIKLLSEEGVVRKFRNQAIGNAVDFSLQESIGAGYESKELASRFLTLGVAGVTTEMLKPYNEIQETMGGSITGSIYSSLFNHASPVVGGMEGFGSVERGAGISSYVGTLGGDRVEVTMTKEQYKEKVEAGDIVPDSVKSHFSENIMEWGKAAESFVDGYGAFTSKPFQYMGQGFNVGSADKIRLSEIHQASEYRERQPIAYAELFHSSLTHFQESMTHLNQPALTFNGDDASVALQVVDWAMKSDLASVPVPKDNKGNEQLEYVLRSDLTEVAKDSPAHAIQEVTHWLEMRYGIMSQMNPDKLKR